MTRSTAAVDCDAAPLDPADARVLDRLQKAAFDYFAAATNPLNGLVADRGRAGSPSSIAVVGLALSAHTVGVERGWIARDVAVARALAALRFFWHSKQDGSAASTGFKGFYFHFLDMTTGLRTWECELSIIDTALLMAGVLTAAAYFAGDAPAEVELRGLAEALYRRVDWRWAQGEDDAVALGWKPDSGFLAYGWMGYDEALILYVLGLGSPSHPLSAASFRAWTMTYQWENMYGQEFLYAGPLFIHQLSHAWLDLRGVRDDFMREKRSDYFENSRRATIVQREYARRNPLDFRGYGADRWGLSAGDGPKVAPVPIAGRSQSFYGYAARGVPYGPDDGTIAGPAMLASLPFAPDLVLPVVRGLCKADRLETDRTLLAGGFNDSAPGGPEGGAWVSQGAFGFDQGLVVLAIENFRSGLVWRLTRGIPCFRAGLRRAGFRGGWLGGRWAPR